MLGSCCRWPIEIVAGPEVSEISRNSASNSHAVADHL